MGKCIEKLPKEKYVRIRDKFYVSNLGNVMSVSKYGELTPLKLSDNGNGYLTASGEYVHRLVAEAFLVVTHLKTVNHKDENKANNVVTNLEYMSHKDNNRYSNSKKIVQLCKGEVVREYEAVRHAEDYGFDASTICKVIKGKLNHHKGFQWRYK